jgi:hypothetical protein
MTFLQTHFWPGGTEAQYEATVAAVHPAGGGLPPGQLYHAAGPTEGGMLIAVVWDEKANAERFLTETLLPATPVDGGLVGPPEERAAETVSFLKA